MNKLNLQQTWNKLKFKTIKNSPQILIYAGAVGVVASGIMACKATLKLESITKESREKIVEIKTTRDDESITDYTSKEAKQDLAVMYSSIALDVAKLYAPSIILGGLSLAAMIQSHNILNRRNAALAAAFTTATESFNRYRKAVVEKYGEDVDKELRFGIRKEKTTVEDENGKSKKETVDVVNPLSEYSDYARFYDDGCDGWSKDPSLNMLFLKQQQQYANDKLIAQGYLFLNDVYRMLGIPDSKAGQVVGWIYNADHPEGDNYVDFGIMDKYKENCRDFVNGYEPVILLDFNVDGNIWEKMGE